jgi:hypothetical protein
MCPSSGIALNDSGKDISMRSLPPGLNEGDCARAKGTEMDHAPKKARSATNGPTLDGDLRKAGKIKVILQTWKAQHTTGMARPEVLPGIVTGQGAAMPLALSPA